MQKQVASASQRVETAQTALQSQISNGIQNTYGNTITRTDAQNFAKSLEGSNSNTAQAVNKIAKGLEESHGLTKDEARTVAAAHALQTSVSGGGSIGLGFDGVPFLTGGLSIGTETKANENNSLEKSSKEASQLSKMRSAMESLNKDESVAATLNDAVRSDASEGNVDAWTTGMNKTDQRNVVDAAQEVKQASKTYNELSSADQRIGAEMRHNPMQVTSRMANVRDDNGVNPVMKAYMDATQGNLKYQKAVNNVTDRFAEMGIGFASHDQEKIAATLTALSEMGSPEATRIAANMYKAAGYGMPETGNSSVHSNVAESAEINAGDQNTRVKTDINESMIDQLAKEKVAEPITGRAAVGDHNAQGQDNVDAQHDQNLAHNADLRREQISSKLAGRKFVDGEHLPKQTAEEAYPDIGTPKPGRLYERGTEDALNEGYSPRQAHIFGKVVADPEYANGLYKGIEFENTKDGGGKVAGRSDGKDGIYSVTNPGLSEKGQNLVNTLAKESNVSQDVAEGMLASIIRSGTMKDAGVATDLKEFNELNAEAIAEYRIPFDFRDQPRASTL
ncbi:hypothetical protein GCM10023116_14950 [Kistimonas scapharcae]|uniref:Uncharacterized protein n=1 Tax=Kistimonas scapharcae TaxID=1036133 RepID=A0ABP8V1U9_9GAMM